MKVDCDFKKWGDRQHYRFDLERLGRDEHGTWLAARPPVTVTAGPRAPFDMQQTFVTVVPDDDWWIATFYAPRLAEIDIYVDIATPATWVSEAHITSVDLDLDVVRYRVDGRIEIVDEDELEEHTVLYGYPDDIVQRAKDAADEIVRAMADRREPFGEVGWTWLDQL